MSHCSNIAKCEQNVQQNFIQHQDVLRWSSELANNERYVVYAVWDKFDDKTDFGSAHGVLAF